MANNQGSKVDGENIPHYIPMQDKLLDQENLGLREITEKALELELHDKFLKITHEINQKFGQIIADSNRAMHVLEAKIEHFKEDIAPLENKHQTHSKEILALHSKIESQRVELSSYGEFHMHLKKEFEVFTVRLNSACDLIAKQSQHIHSQHSNIESCKTNVDEQLAQQREALLEQRHEKNLLSQKIDAFEKDICDRLRNFETSLIAHLQNPEEIHEKLEKKVEKLEGEFETNLSEWEKKISSMEQALKRASRAMPRHPFENLKPAPQKSRQDLMTLGRKLQSPLEYLSSPGKQYSSGHEQYDSGGRKAASFVKSFAFAGLVLMNFVLVCKLLKVF